MFWIRKSPNILILLLTTHFTSPNDLKSTKIRTLLSYRSIFKISLFTSPMKFQFALYLSSWRLATPFRMKFFSFGQDKLPKTKIFCSILSFTPKTYPGHLTLSFMIALEDGKEPHLGRSLLLDIQSFKWIPKIIHRQLLLENTWQIPLFSEGPAPLALNECVTEYITNSFFYFQNTAK